jgi:hypothetical protein
MSRLAFTRVITSLKPYLSQIVLVGGWAHRLFQEHPWGRRLEFEVLMTEDVDLGVPLSFQKMPEETPSMHRLLIEAGFRWTPREGGDLYSLGVEDDNFQVEFIAPLVGSSTERDGFLKPRIQVSGVNIERFRYIDLLLAEPWEYSLVSEQSLLQFPVRIANPASYLMQKVLTVRRRPQLYKKAKDVLYIHDTILIFQENLDMLQNQANKFLELLPERTQGDFQKLRQELFNSVISQKAAQIAEQSGRATPPSANRIKEVCVAGLEIIFKTE